MLRNVLAYVADLTVAAAFAAPGYRLRAPDFAPLRAGDPPQRVVVTGANAGLGLALTRQLLDAGAEVVMACRDEARGGAALDSLGDAGRRARVERLDVQDLESVAAFADRVGTIDGVVHNAGSLVHRRLATPQGIEQTLAVHVVGPYLLTRLLAPGLATRPDPRVVFVSSGGMYGAQLDADGMFDPPEPFDGVRAYARCKRAQVTLARLLADEIGPRVLVASMHPGWADTGGVRDALPRFHAVTRTFLRTPAQGADTAAWLALAPRDAVRPGAFYLDRLPRREHMPGAATRVAPDAERALIDRLDALVAPWTGHAANRNGA